MGPISALRAGLIAVFGFVSSACSGGPVFLPPSEQPDSVYGAVLSASYANRIRDIDRSAQLYAEALEFDANSALVTERAFLAALTAGQFRRADQAAAQAVQQDGASQLVHRYRDAARLAGMHLRSNEAREPDADRFSALVASILADWQSIDDQRSARNRVADGLMAEPMSAMGYRLVHRALVMELAGRTEEAERSYRAADAALNLRDFTTVLLGEFLERQGRADEAAVVYRAQIARSVGRADPEVEAALARVEAGQRAPRIPNAQRAAARALFAPAAFLVVQAPPEYAALYLRLIERIDPRFYRAQAALADLLEELELTEEAIAAYDGLADSVFSYDAGVSAAWLRFANGDAEAATNALERLVRGEPYHAELALADMRRVQGQCAAALTGYQSVIEAIAANKGVQDWRHSFYAGICTEQTQGFAAAEPLYVQALDLAPFEPLILNHLGYSWIVGGVRVDEGVALTERAVALAPENGSILDSYGWGLFKLERFDEAVTALEDAAARSPENATIQWHLGDAYAAVGRSLEAGFQWNRALELEPDNAEIDLIERRLELGLEAGPEDVS